MRNVRAHLASSLKTQVSGLEPQKRTSRRTGIRRLVGASTNVTDSVRVPSLSQLELARSAVDHHPQVHLPAAIQPAVGPVRVIEDQGARPCIMLSALVSCECGIGVDGRQQSERRSLSVASLISCKILSLSVSVCLPPLTARGFSRVPGSPCLGVSVVG